MVWRPSGSLLFENTMTIETIKCQECGSADVIELKTGSYACQHCEAVFKHVRPASDAGVAACEFGGCGVLAAGRCRECRRAFCEAHAEHASGFGPAAVRCAACVQAEREQKLKSEQQSRLYD